MAVRTCSKKAQGGERLSEHFTVAEFACSDGSDKVLIDDRLVALLERIRTWAGAPVSVTSGYRTPAYNKRINGAKNSLHINGQASDIVVAGKTPAQVAKLAEAIGVHGIGLYTKKRFVHVDTRTGTYRWRNVGNGDEMVTTHGGKCPYSRPTSALRRGDSGNGVLWLQWWLNLWGAGLCRDGSFGAKTDAAVREFQKRGGLAVDGVAGDKTKGALTLS